MSDEVAWELTTVADDEAVAFRGTEVRRYEDLQPGTAYELDGMAFTTLPRPPGERLATVATVNDVHFGEEAAGIIAGSDIGPILRTEPGESPYPEVMNRAAVAEIAAAEPDAVVAKGDLTSGATEAEHQAFLDCYGRAFDDDGGRLTVVRGNHDVCGPHTFADDPVQEVALPGVVLAVLDTAVPGQAVIYIVRTPMDSREMGGLWLGERVQIATFGGTYYRWEVPPGTYRISTAGFGNAWVTLNATAGNVYFVEHTVRGTMRSGPQSVFLRRVDEQYGRAAVGRSELL